MRTSVHDQGESNRVDCDSHLSRSDVCAAKSLPVLFVDPIRNPVAFSHCHGKPRTTEDQTR